MHIKRLILMRHAKADPSFTGGDDLGRGITQTGIADAQTIALQLVERGLQPDHVLCSPARRTLQTWTTMKPHYHASIEIIEALYLAEADRIRTLIENHTGQTGTLMVLGHNPGLLELAVALMGVGVDANSATSRLYQGMPTASVAVFENLDNSDTIDDFTCTDFLVAR